MKFDANALMRVARQIFRIAEPVIRERLNDRSGSRSGPKSGSSTRTSSSTPSPSRNTSDSSRQYDDAAPGSWERGGYPGDYPARSSQGVAAAYAPNPNGAADPGEVVWAWVPYEEDYSRGKDRPVLVIGRDGEYLLGLMLTTKDRDNSVRHNPGYIDVGTGGWDSKGRPSEAKLDRVIRLRQDGIRREGAVLSRETYDDVAQAMREGF